MFFYALSQLTGLDISYCFLAKYKEISDGSKCTDISWTSEDKTQSHNIYLQRKYTDTYFWQFYLK